MQFYAHCVPSVSTRLVLPLLLLPLVLLLLMHGACKGVQLPQNLSSAVACKLVTCVQGGWGVFCMDWSHGGRRAWRLG